jgi:hypothetical protein
MRHSFYLAGLLPLLVACQTSPSVGVPPGVRVVARYRVLDAELSPRHAGCEQADAPPPAFLEASPSACSFTLRGRVYDVVDKCLLDAQGGLTEYWRYRGDGAAIQTLAQLQQDSLYFRERGLVRFRAVLASEGTRVVDGQDTLRIAQHFPAEKLLLAQAEGSAQPDERIFYQYQ